MRVPRETVYTRLFNLIATTPVPGGGTWNLKGRRVLDWDDVPPASQPAIFLHQTTQTADQNQAMFLTKWELNALVWIYFRTDASKDQATNPDTAVNAYLDAFEATIDPVPGRKQTLGGLVENCWINGVCLSNSGVDDGQGVIMIPLTLLTGI